MSEPIRVVSRHDPAVDWKKSNAEEYGRTLDLSRLTLVGKPIVYSIVDLEWPEYQEVLARVNVPGLAADCAFRLGVVAIEGCRALCADGLWHPLTERVREGVPVKTIGPSEMAAIFKSIAPKHILDIGKLLIERAEAERPGNGAGGAG